MNTHLVLLLKPRALASCLAAFLAVLILSYSTQAASIYWDGTGTSWNSVGSWSTSISTTTNPAAVPVSGDTAIFNTNGVNTLQTVNLDANQSVGGTGGLSFNVNATGGVTLLGGDADHTLALGTAGIGINAAAGPVTIGSATAGQGVSLILGGNQNWANNGSSLLTINNGVSNSAGSTISLTGSGTGGVTFNGIISNGTGNTALTVNNGSTSTLTTLAGANTYTGATTITKGTVVVNGANGAMTGTSSISIGAGSTLQVDDSTANANRLNNSAGITLNNGGVFRYLGSASTSAETTGAFTLGAGVSTVTVSSNGANTAKVTTAAATNGFTRTASSGGIALLNGVNLGLSTAGQFVTGTSPALVGTTPGGTTGINSSAKDTQIARFVVGESGAGTGENGTATGTANTFLTYNATTGYRPLNPTDEFTSNGITAGNNTYLSSGTTTTAGTAAINSLVVNGGNLSITSGDTVTDTSAMLLFAQNGKISGAGTFALGTSSREAIVVVNPGVSGTISSALSISSGAPGLTVYGGGALTLSGANSYTGTTAISSGSTLVVGNNGALGTSTISAIGGTIKGDGQARTITNTLINGITVSGTPSSMTVGGGSDLNFSGTGSTPAWTNTEFANAAINVTNTGTTTISGVYSLVNKATGSNNGGSILRLGSSANVVITGAIQDNNAGNTAAPTTGWTVVVAGVGANLTINPTAANNNGLAGRTVSFSNSPALSNYTVTVGGPGGSGATITPFGAATSSLQLSNTTTVYLAAATNGQILGNNITSGGSGVVLGFDGENSMTLGGTMATAATGSGFTNLSTATFTFGNTVTLGATLNILGTGNTTFNSNATFAAGTSGLSANQTGTLTFSNTNNLTGNTTLNGGTVVLDYSAGSAGGGTNRLTQRNAVASSAAALSLGGVNLQLSAGSFAQTLGTPTSGSNGTTLTSGQSKITQTNSGTSTIALGGITRNAGSAIDFQTGVASTSTGNTSGILGGYATVGGTDWASVGANIAALGSYDSFVTPGADKNILQTDGVGVTVDTAVNSLKIATTTASQVLAITTAKTLSLTSGGLLFTGANDFSITGGTLKSTSTSASDLVIQQYGSGALQIDSVIANGNGASTLTKAGTGALVLTGTNTYTGNTYVSGGILSVNADANLGATASSAIVLNGGTLKVTGSGFTTAHTTSLGANGGTFLVDSGTLTLNSSAVISGGSLGGLTKTGAGTLLLQAANTFTGPVTVTEGTLKLGNAAALGASSSTSNRTTAPVLVNGGTLDINGQTTELGKLTLQGGSISDTTGTGSLAAYSFNLRSGTVGAKMIDLVIAGNTSNSINVYKTTAGTVTVTGANTYSGSTIVSAGALLVNNSTGSGTGTGHVTVNGGTLGGTGTISPTGTNGITVNTGAFVAPGASIGTLVIDGGSTTGALLSMNAGSEFNFELGTGVSSDKLNIWNYVDGDFAINSNAINFTLDPSVVSGSKTFNLFNFYTDSGTSLSGATFSGLALGTLSSNIGSAAFDYTTPGQINLNITAVPEPSTWALLAFSLTTVLVLRRRRA